MLLHVTVLRYGTVLYWIVVLVRVLSVNLRQWFWKPSPGCSECVKEKKQERRCRGRQTHGRWTRRSVSIKTQSGVRMDDSIYYALHYTTLVPHYSTTPHHISRLVSSRFLIPHHTTHEYLKHSRNNDRMIPSTRSGSVFMDNAMLSQSKSASPDYEYGHWFALNLRLAFVAAMILLPLVVFFWGPLLRLINEYRLYRRCKQYPHMIVCKDKSKLRASSSSLSNRIIKDWILPIAGFLWNVLFWCCRKILSNTIGAIVLTSTSIFTATKVSTRNEESQKTAPEHEVPPLRIKHQPLSTPGPKEEEKRTMMSTSARGRIDSDSLPATAASFPKTTSPLTSHSHLPETNTKSDLFLKGETSNTNRSSSTTTTTKQYYYDVRVPAPDQRELEGVHKSSSPQPLPNSNQIDQRQRVPKRQYKISPVQLLQRRHGVIFHGENINGIVRMKAAKRRLPSPMAAALTQGQHSAMHMHIDPSSLSEKMRKRRLNGETSKGISGNGSVGVAPRQQDGGAASRKKRKLNSGRAPLQQYVARRPTVGAWKTTKVLDKREREEREERLLRGMNRKRSKHTPATGKTKTATSTGTESAIAANTYSNTNALVPASTSASAPAFSFGQTQTPTKTNATPVSTSTPVPAFQFGNNNNKQASSDPTSTQPIQGANNDGVAATAPSKPEPVSHAAPPAFSFGSASTSTTITNSNAATNSGKPEPTPAPTLAPVPLVPKFGAAPTQSATAPAQSAPAFGATAPAPATFGAATPSTANAFGASSGFSAASVPQQSSSQGFNQMSFGTQAAKPENSQPSFGNMKENQAPASGFSKYQPSNMNSHPPLGMKGGFSAGASYGTAMPSFGGSSAGGFNAGNAPVVATGTASARRMARKSRTRRK